MVFTEPEPIMLVFLYARILQRRWLDGHSNLRNLDDKQSIPIIRKRVEKLQRFVLTQEQANFITMQTLSNFRQRLKTVPLNNSIGIWIKLPGFQSSTQVTERHWDWQRHVQIELPLLYIAETPTFASSNFLDRSVGARNNSHVLF